MKRQILTPKGITFDCGGDKTLIIKTTQTREEINLIGFEKHFGRWDSGNERCDKDTQLMLMKNK